MDVSTGPVTTSLFSSASDSDSGSDVYYFDVCRFHVDDGGHVFFFEYPRNEMPHRGMGAAHSPGASVVDPAHNEQPNIVWRPRAELFAHRAGRLRLLEDRSGDG